MSFAAIAALLSGQRPYFLYCFKRGGEEFRFTTLTGGLTKAVTGVVGTDWAASAVSHQKITNSDKVARAEFPIVFPLSDAFARSCLAPIGINRVTVTIWRGFTNDVDGELIVLYRGGLINISPTQAKTIALTFTTDQTALQRLGLSQVIQRPCRHVLYGRGCRLDVDDFKTSGSMTAITTDGITLTVPAADAQPDGYYNAGIFFWGTSSEMILSHVGETLTLASRIVGLTDAFAADGAQAVDLAPGCNLTTTVCAERFDNLDNHGGFAVINDTPFDGRSII